MRDRQGREIDYLRLSVTDRCNMRCIYCMPSEGVPLYDHAEILRFEEIERLAGIFRTAGIRKVRITGGEPLLRRDLPVLVAGLSRCGFDKLVLTSNGLLLERHAGALAAAGLDRVNVSLDSLKDEVLAAISGGTASVQAIEQGISAAIEAGLTPVRVNCVVLKGLNDGEIPDMLLWASEAGVHLRFIEHMPARLGEAHFLPAERILAAASVLGETVSMGREPGGVQTTWSIPSEDITFGIVAPVSDPQFCRDCRRLRLSSTGLLLSCLSRPEGFDLKACMRGGADDTALLGMIEEAVEMKPAASTGCRNLSMWRTGG